MAVTPVVASAARPDTTVPAGGGGGELIDGSTFPQETPASIDPQINTELDSYQVIRLMYDGLTDIDVTGDQPATVPHQAESYESNADATVWTFKIREGLAFADGEPILPSTYVRSWERAGHLQGPYSYLLDFIQGGNELRTGTVDTLEGAVADDDAMTLTVTLSAPFAEFDAVAGFQLFRPTPQGAVDAGDTYDQGVMIGSGAYTMDTARNDQEIVLVKNDAWTGDYAGNTWDQRPDTIRFVISQDVDTSFNALEAGEVMSATVPSGRSADAMETWGNSLATPQLAVYYYAFDFRDEIVGGPDNLLLRQAISQAIDRDAINDAVYDGVRITATGITPPGIAGFKEDICQYCHYDPEAAQASFDEWTAAGHSQSGPIPIQFNEGGVHGDVTDIIVENLAAIGIEAEPDPQPSEGYFADFLGAGEGCVLCRVGWIADYPTYSNFTLDILGTPALNGNNYSYSNPAFDDLVAEAMATIDPDQRAGLFNQAEELVLNTDTMIVPINWYVGDLAWDESKVEGFSQDLLGFVHFEQTTVIG